MDKRTPLYDEHIKLNGKMVPFGGFLLPVQYVDSGLVTEHLAVRNQVGLFDVSHMGEIFFEGSDALANIQEIFTNDFSTMVDGQIRYTLMCQDDGGIIDDLIIYKYHQMKYMAVVNASNRDKDLEWINAHTFGDVTITDKSDNVGLLALQGPSARKVLEKLVQSEDFPDKYYSFKDGVSLGNSTIMLSETGYTGEAGYELYIPVEDIVRVWQLLLEAGAEFGIVPAGLGARDTLRMEAGMPLYGHEMTTEITPLEAKLNFAVKLNKDSFIGKEALEKQLEPEKVRVGLKVVGKGIVREDAPVLIDENEIGISTSGTHAPFLGYPIAMAYVDKKHSAIGTPVMVQVRKRQVSAEIVALPFYKRNK